MKRRAIITIEVDEEGKPQTSETKTHHFEPGFIAANITVYPDSLVKKSGQQELISALAHELGHTVAALFQTPAHEADPRITGNLFTRFRLNEGDAKPGEGPLMTAAEQEAWDIARLIWPELSTVDEERALDTYRSIEAVVTKGE